MRIPFVVCVLLTFRLALAGNLVVRSNGVPEFVATGTDLLPPLTTDRIAAELSPVCSFGVDSIPAPDTTPFGLAHDGTWLWNVSLFGQRVYKLDPATGSVIRSFSAPDQWSKGLCWDGQHLWLTGNYQSRIYKVDTTAGGVVASFPAPGSNPTGVTWDGTWLWVADINSQQSRPSFIFKLDPGTGARLDSLEAPCRMVADLAWDGSHIWVNDMDNAIAYALDPSTGNVVAATGIPGSQPTGILHAAGRLWVTDWNRRFIWTFHPDSGPAALTLQAPAQWDVLPTHTDAVLSGTVCGLGLDSFRLEYGFGRNPTQWFPTGAVHTDPVFDDTFELWNLTSITEPGEFTVRLRAHFGSLADSSRQSLIGIDPAIAPGWPKVDENISPIACADINPSDGWEVIAGTRHQHSVENRLNVWSLDGLLVWWRSGIGNSHMPPAVGDVNHDGLNEIATGFDLNRNNVFLVYPNGTIMNGWPQDGVRPGDLRYHGIPVLADADADSVLEVFSGGGRLSGWDTSGARVPGWPVSMQSSSPAVADFDADGSPEFVAVRNDSVYLFKADGAVAPGWPVGFGYAGGYTFPTVGDIEHDGRLEIAFTLGNRLYCVDDSGEVLSGFPKTLAGNYANSPVFGDVDRDDTLEVVVVSGTFPSNSVISVIRCDGSSQPGWPQTLNSLVFRNFNGPAIGDVDGDQVPDIVMGFESVEGFELLYAWNKDGEVIEDWPRRLREIYGYGITGAPVLGDFDDDGMLDCAVSSNAYWVANSDIYVWNLGVPFSAGTMEWPRFRHDKEMTGTHGWLTTGISQPKARAQSQPTLLAAPIPVRTTGTVRFNVPTSTPAVVVITDVAGRSVQTLSSVPGRCEVLWDLKDRKGNQVPAGVYFAGSETASLRSRVKLVVQE